MGNESRFISTLIGMFLGFALAFSASTATAYAYGFKQGSDWTYSEEAGDYIEYMSLREYDAKRKAREEFRQALELVKQGGDE